MKGFYICITLVVIGFSSIFSQLQNPVTDFKISTDNDPSTIIQSNPKMFCNGTKGFLVTWQDYRNGEPETYAQWFDSVGNKVSNNFEIYSNNSIRFSEDGTYIGLQEEYYDYYAIDMSGVNILGRVYDKNNKPSETFSLGGGQYPWCATGWLGFDWAITNSSEGYIYVNSNDGRLTSLRLNRTGEIRNYLDLDTVLSARSAKVDVATNKNDDYMVLYFNGGFNFYNPSPDTLPFGIFASIFNHNDSLIIKDVLIDKYSDFNRDQWISAYDAPPFKIFNIEDSLFQIFWINKDSLVLHFAKFNSGGIKSGKTQKFNLPHSTLGLNGYRTIDNFTFSNVDNNKFVLFISTAENGNDSIKYYNVLLYFDKSGSIIDSQFNYSKFLSLGNQIFKKGDNSFLTVNTIDNNIYLTELNNFNILNINKINDDEIGSNETNPEITVLDHKTNFVTWNNETKYFGQKIDLNGNLIKDQKILNGIRCVFSPDGKCLNTWKKGVNPNLFQAGYSIYNSKWELLKEEVLLTSNDSYSINDGITKISDSLYILYTSSGYYNYSVKTLDQNFEQINEKSFSGTELYSIKFYKENENSFWISFPNTVQLFSSTLQPLSEKYNLYTHLYLGNNTFLTIDNNCPYGSYTICDKYGQIYNTSGDTLIDHFYLAGKTDDFRLCLLPTKDILAIWQSDNKLYARAFSPEGHAKTDSFMIHSDIKSLKKQPAVAINGDKVIFVWADARNEGRGYDIYGSIFDLSKVVEVKENKQTELPTQFILYQNYPNPFNPVTKIKYSIPAVGTRHGLFVHLKIYDILGNEVAKLVNEAKPAGTYEVEFNASNLSSGVYFYQLRVSVPSGKAGNFIETKKFVLMK